MTYNPIFLLAVATLGWGFSLAIYRPLALRCHWPMGVMQSRHPLIIALLGIAALVFVFLFIWMDAPARWPVLPLGLLFALFWLGFLRVASQVALFLAPLAAILLGVVWASTDDGLREMRAIDDKLIDRAGKMEQRLEERMRIMMEKAKGLRQPTLEELERAAPPAKKAP